MFSVSYFPVVTLYYSAQSILDKRMHANQKRSHKHRQKSKSVLQPNLH